MLKLKSEKHSGKGSGRKVRRIPTKLSAFISLVLCIAAVVYIFTLNVAYAVSVDGEFVGYASNVTEIDQIVDDVSETASNALGCDYTVKDSVDCHLTIGTADNDIQSTVEQKLLDNIDSIGNYAVVLVDDVPFCAFETESDASAALSDYISSYVTGNTKSVHFLQDVKVSVTYADTQLLSVSDDFSAKAKDVIEVETIDDETSTKAVPFETEYVDDDVLYVDETVTDTAGVDGALQTTSEITRINGETVSSTVLSSEQTLDPVNAVIRRGTKEHLSTGTYIWPAEGQITSYFGYRSGTIGSTYHQGIDIAAHYGDDIVAADGGTVIYSDYDGDYGNLIQIQHENGDITYYAHCSELLKQVGDSVAQGELIAHMGSTGNSSGVHVHFEYHPAGGSAIDPLSILP